jgi:isopropylmalate/homocitrate/citramalate synthase
MTDPAEPIQDDIETLRKLLHRNISWASPWQKQALAALDRLVAERDEAREFKLNGMTPEQVFDRFRALEAERDAARDAAATYSDLAAEHKAERDRFIEVVEAAKSIEPKTVRLMNALEALEDQ